MEKNLDRNRIDRMVGAALKGEMPEELGKMADQLTEPADVLASFLVGDTEGYDENLPCSREQWDFFMSRCRQETKGELGHEIAKAKLGTYARIGQWPTRIPTLAKEVCKDFFDIGFGAAWSYAWLQDKERWTRLLNGDTPGFKPASTSSGWVVARGLADAIRNGLVEVPEEQKVCFAVAYGDWYANVGVSNADVAYLCYWALGFQDPKKLPDSDLQALAGYWGPASAELGRRRISLAVPLLQDARSWVFGYLDTVEVPDSVEEAAEIYAAKGPVQQYKLHQHFTRNGRRVKVPADPFGPEINELQLLLQEQGLTLWKDFWGRWEVRCPTHEQCVEHLHAASQKV